MKRLFFRVAAAGLLLLFAAGPLAAAVSGSRALPEPPRFTPGASFELAVTVTVTDAAVSGFVLREYLPAGWTVTGHDWPGSVSHEKADNSWGFVYLGRPPGGAITLTCQVRVPAGEVAPERSLSGHLDWYDDLLFRRRAVGGGTRLTRSGPARGDINADGRVNAADARLALLLAAGAPLELEGTLFTAPYGQLVERLGLAPGTPVGLGAVLDVFRRALADDDP